jgi:hypothetical protein
MVLEVRKNVNYHKFYWAVVAINPYDGVLWMHCFFCFFFSLFGMNFPPWFKLFFTFHLAEVVARAFCWNWLWLIAARKVELKLCLNWKNCMFLCFKK